MDRNAKYTKLINNMSVHAQKDYPIEVCGLITTDFEYIECKNLSPIAKNAFILDPIKLLEYEDNTWGIFHSHPGEENPLPSEDDVKHTIFDEYKFIVGFANKFYIYWYDYKLELLRYEPFEIQHLC